MIDVLVRTQIKNMQEINWGDVPDDNPNRLLWGENQQTLAIYKDAIIKEIKKINLYPTASKLRLRQKLAVYNTVQPANIILTNGSDEALELIAKVFVETNDEVIIPVPSYPGFSSVSEMMGAKINFVKLEKDFSLDIKKIQDIITDKTKIVWIANPNNPTGNVLVTKNQIETLAKNNKCLFVIDECYFELSQVTAVQLINQYPNIIVTRSFSKVFALAGARLGYIIANEKVASFLNKLQQTNQVFNVNRFAYVCGLTIMSNPLLIKKSIKKFKELQQTFEQSLNSIGIKPLPTRTTFILAKLPQEITAKTFKEKLLNQGVYIKDCSIYAGLGDQYIYLGIPEQQYQKQCIMKMKKILEEALC